jgi:hypothetical protein
MKLGKTTVYEILIVLLVITVMLVSCAPDPRTQNTQINKDDTANFYLAMGDGGVNVTRYIDEEADVVCWVMTGYNRGGVSCLPLHETSLTKSQGGGGIIK